MGGGGGEWGSGDLRIIFRDVCRKGTKNQRTGENTPNREKKKRL